MDRTTTGPFFSHLLFSLPVSASVVLLCVVQNCFNYLTEDNVKIMDKQVQETKQGHFRATLLYKIIIISITFFMSEESDLLKTPPTVCVCLFVCVVVGL